MSMRAPASDLPVMFVEVAILAGEVTILDDISLTLEAGAPTVLIGPNGAGKTTLLRAAMGLIPATRGRITWGGRETAPPTRRAIMFQRPAMLRRSAAGNIRYALAAAGVPRGQRATNAPPNCWRWSGSKASNAARRGGCRAASSSGWRWRARWRATRPCCFSTSRPPASIPPPPRRSRTSCAPSPRAASRW